jgi:D-glycero-beta-D-manno-heptose-7-phosphate kinase
MDKKRLFEITDNFKRFRIGVVGDLILDRYIWGKATRISPEAPVPIVKAERKTSALGGAANVLRNLSTLKTKPVSFGILGNDVDGRETLQLCRNWNIETKGIVLDSTRQTTVKTRLIADRQQVVRIDDEKDTPIDDACRGELLNRISAALTNGELDALVIEDYHKGVVSNTLVREIQTQADSSGIPLALDPHPGHQLEISGLKLITPNRSEAFTLAGEYFTPTVLPLEEDEKLCKVAARLLSRWSPGILLITLGSEGMALFVGNDEPIHMPTKAREVFDVSGAGDTVIATFITAFLAGADPLEAADISNHAAGIAVGQIGTFPVALEDIHKSFDF